MQRNFHLYNEHIHNVQWTVAILRPSQRDMPIDLKPGHGNIFQKSTFCGISGKAPWHVAL
jgi:hypothetical protein